MKESGLSCKKEEKKWSGQSNLLALIIHSGFLYFLFFTTFPVLQTFSAFRVGPSDKLAEAFVYNSEFKSGFREARSGSQDKVFSIHIQKKREKEIGSLRIVR